uniref:Uncharacterized protein n=1 Tax=Aegilops tauschii subsp. strangulata TaxID=200361 RepID=A0A453AHX1_AEGTS
MIFFGMTQCRSTKMNIFSQRKNWKQLLDGKRTYLRPPRGHHVLSDVFKCPDTRKAALGRQKRLSRLVEKHSKNFFKEKIKILCQHYAHFRRTRGDGSCFYRAFLFSYLENLGLMQDSQAEVTRLMEHVAMSRENFCRLKWDKAYFLNPEEYFSSVVSEFSHLVNSVANGYEFLTQCSVVIFLERHGNKFQNPVVSLLLHLVLKQVLLSFVV